MTGAVSDVSPRSAPATLHDVAREAGVSLATASRVLNGSTRKVADAYRSRVEDSARRLGYSANLSAQATARGSSAVIALLVADIADPYFGLIASGVARGADEAGLIVTIAITERDPERETVLVRALRGQRPRGLILAASRVGQTVPEELQYELDAYTGSGGRIVALGPGAGDVRSVTIDNCGGSRELALALVARGYRAAVLLGAAEGMRTSDERLAGFTEGFIAGGGVIERVHRGAFTREGGRAAMTEALAAGIPRGNLVVFGTSDVVAIGAATALRDAGWRVGIDAAVAGFDDIPTGRDMTPALTTVHVPLEDLGYQALRAAIDDTWIPADLPLEVRLRDSTPPR